MHVSKRKLITGFSLFELIAGIVVFSAVMVIVITLVVNQSQQSIEPIWQTRASELAQSLSAEISAKAFDENATMSGGFSRCGDTNACTVSANLGPDAGETSRALFDDIDDYNGLGPAIENAVGNAIEQGGDNLYKGFQVQVSVIYDTDFDGVAENLADPTVGDFSVKRIQITVTTPGGDTLDYAFYKWDF
ncbi:prepilin-type cleavage/methylation-like protein [Alteromonas sediminis]|uniref:Prepilin-type cleavage/methylation-like protein n=1 Tax=Alteromonas sediminis TaxID=2259342 RepID=A0A3N5Y9K3_9ALTE|nr:prepilin-type cleavage/methylation-like protein [Alteromonas sediminis]RPJ65325.1 prepilin-type cleavage/methylation-like protein [Alteromonas sediminis]